MKKKANLHASKFHWLTVIGESKTRLMGQVTWECRCECGGRRLATSQMLLSGNAKSCGCMNFKLKNHGNRKFDTKTSLLRAKASNYKAQAKARGLSWELSTEEAVSLIGGTCNYCGGKPSSPFNHPSLPQSGSIMINGIDRVDNKRGYVTGNVVPCCTICNTAKGTMSAKEFISWAKSVTNYSHENSCNQ